MSIANTNLSKILVNGEWRQSSSGATFCSINPALGTPNETEFPVSNWADCEVALAAADEAYRECRSLPVDRIASFLEAFADAIDRNKEALVEIAHLETGLPKSPRLADVELPRTSNQLRQAASAAKSESWRNATIDTKLNIRSCYESLGPVVVFGPNNFPFAFNSIAGGDFAAAIAAGNPVIGKANSSHPGTTELLARLASRAIEDTNMPSGLVQLIYRTSHADGERLVSDHRVGAIGYTGARRAGLQLKSAADRAGKPFYAELSSVNPVVMLPGALAERGEQLVSELATSGLMGAGQFCTNPGLVLLVDDEASKRFVSQLVEKYDTAAPGTLLSPSVRESLLKSIGILSDAGAQLLAGGSSVQGPRCAVANTILKTDGSSFLQDPAVFQTEAFGNAVLFVLCRDVDQIQNAIEALEGNLTGTIYSHTQGADETDYVRLALALSQRVGRLLNDKMPTGVAVSPAMNHGGPYPATSHPGFTAVGIPASLIRFAKLTCYDAVRETRLPNVLRNSNPSGAWRLVDGNWTNGKLS